jgi:hypothetical protein
MKTKQRIAQAFARIGTTLANVVDTHPSYCPTIRPSTFGNADGDPEADSDLAARAFDAQMVIRGEARRAWHPRNAKRWPAICQAVEAQVNQLKGSKQ